MSLYKQYPYTLLSFSTSIADASYSDSELKQLRLHRSAEARVKGKHIRYSLSRLRQTDFWKSNAYLFGQKTGVGYWLWKPYIIREALEQMKDDEVLIYCDGSFYFIESPLELIPYINPKSGLGFFVDRSHTLGQIMHDRAIRELNVPKEMLTRHVIIAGLILIRKSKASLRFVGDWLDLCLQPSLLMDDNEESSRPEFVKHKNDMALLSYLVHKENLPYSVPPTISHHTSFLADNSDFPRIILNWDKNGFGCKRPLVHLLKPSYVWTFLKKKIRPQ